MGAILVAAGFADYPLIAYHFTRAETVPGNWIAIFYSVAMAVSGTGSLVLGRLFDRYGFIVLVILNPPRPLRLRRSSFWQLLGSAARCGRLGPGMEFY